MTLYERLLNHHEYGCDLTEPPYERECSCSKAWMSLRAALLEAISPATLERK